MTGRGTEACFPAAVSQLQWVLAMKNCSPEGSGLNEKTRLLALGSPDSAWTVNLGPGGAAWAVSAALSARRHGCEKHVYSCATVHRKQVQMTVTLHHIFIFLLFAFNVHVRHSNLADVQEPKGTDFKISTLKIIKATLKPNLSRLTDQHGSFSETTRPAYERGRAIMFGLFFNQILNKSACFFQKEARLQVCLCCLQC